MKAFLLSTTAAIAVTLAPATALVAQETDTIVIGTDVDAGTLDPRLTRDTTASRTANLIYSGLVEIAPNL
jgi:peptide/nickel transport system substrate-binding protein